MGELFAKLDLWNLLIVSAIITFVVSAIKISFSEYFDEEHKHRREGLAFFVALFVTGLNVSLTVMQDKTFWQEAVLQFLLIWSFATIFNKMLGNWFIDKMFFKIKNLLSDDK